MSEEIQLLEELAADGRHLHVTERFLAPVLRQRSLVHTPDPLFALRYLREEAGDLTAEQLEAAAARLLEKRKAKVKAGDLQDAIAEARKIPGKSVVISKSLTPDAYDAWLGHARAHGIKWLVAILGKRGAAHAPSLLPPSLSDGPAKAHGEVHHA